MTTTAKVHRYDGHTPEEWQEFIAAMQSGEVFECDASMADYWLGVLPLVYMNWTTKLPNGRTIRAWFGFAEGAEEVTAFWHEGGRYFGCRTNHVNPFA